MQAAAARTTREPSRRCGPPRPHRLGLLGLALVPQMRGRVVVVVFDEGDTSDGAGGGGQTVALAIEPAVRPGSRDAAPLTHYGLLRTIEDAWRLPRLGASARAKPIVGIWR